MYMFGAVGLVLLNSVTLTAELILKARNGERILKDLRVIVFPSECVFAFYCLVLQMHAAYLQTIKGTQIKDTDANSGSCGKTVEIYSSIAAQFRVHICCSQSAPVKEPTESFNVRGPSGPLVVPLGSSVVLPCYVDEPLPVEGLEVEWRRTDSDTLVNLFLEGESRPEEQHQEYHDRAHFYTDQIQHGNFSLRLDNIRVEDKAVYRCKVYSQQDADKILVEIKDVGFSLLHITVLVFCFVSGSGAVLLLCRLIYCRSKNTVSRSTIWNLQLSLVFFPNICMSIAFIFWGLTEGFLHETVTCCALYILRPVMLIWALPYLKYLQGVLKLLFFKFS
ncbi:Butyrophilin subfamily 3 member A2 [Anabarilius grahami]|uniref:Butyrophilin subfamily 3 member A2 n=1 Tax=Anabarilius grahami TaxID=495550 RepID=A0A3N0YX19_ANAGA|nr:Butyrophilin subfamily 3 member A2 [Anabarilius grahami]